MPGERTVLKGLIGHSNSSGDQAPWECDEEKPGFVRGIKYSIRARVYL